MDKIGSATLIHGDCMEYLRSLPDNAYDLAIVDPPYGINIGNSLGSGKKSYKMHKGWQFDAPSEEYFKELMRVSRSQIIWGGNYFTTIPPPCDNWIIWDKKNPNLTFSEAELAWCSVHSKVRISPIAPREETKTGGYIRRKSLSRFTNGCWRNTPNRATRHSIRTLEAAAAQSQPVTSALNLQVSK